MAALILVAGPTVLAFFSGGFFEKPRLIAGLGAWALAAIAALVGNRPLPSSRAGITAIVGLVLLAAWTAVSYTWAPLGSRAQGDIQRLLLYVGFFVAATALLRGEVARRWLEPGLAAGALVVIGYALSARMLPGVLTFNQSQSAEGRLEQPLTYWNATGCLAALGTVLCLRIAADFSRPRGVRAAAAGAGVPLILGTYLSYSRGSLLALGVGVGILLLLAPVAGDQAKAIAAIGLAGALASLCASFLPAVNSLPRGTVGSQGEGLLMLLVTVVLAAGAALVAARATHGSPAQRFAGRLRAPVVVLLLVVVGAGGLAAVASLENSPIARTAGSPTSATRFGSADSVRYAYWGVALDSFTAHPIEGVGSGGFAVEWRRQPHRAEAAVDAHSLYLETLGELGIVGAVALATFLAGLGAAGARLYARDPGPATGPAAALLAFAVHAGLDWDWEMPALTGIALLLGAALVAWGEQPVPA